MLNRRRFLGYSVAGIIGTASGCVPPKINRTSHQVDPSAHSVFLESKKEIEKHKGRFLGYPLNMNTPPEAFFSWRRELQQVGINEFSYNNVGNPFAENTIDNNTHDLECALIRTFGKIYGFVPTDTWGFLSHSGTDSNMHGMYLGRTILKGRHGTVPKCYFTREAHYSIQILADLLGFDPVYVNTLPDAGMDIEDLKEKLYHNREYPALIVATVGTTFKGGIDDLDRIQEVLQDYDAYVHLDAALFGGYLPHTLGAYQVLHQSNLNRHRYDSIAVSCHKFFGFPSPAGLFITTQSNFDIFHQFYSGVHNPEYIGHVPGTITCSRDSVKPAEFYFYSLPEAIERQASDAQKVLHNTEYLMEQMQNHLAHLTPVRANDLSNTVYFKHPGKRVVEKYSLATMHLSRNGRKAHFAHAVIMPHINRQILGEFLEDLEKATAFELG